LKETVANPDAAIELLAAEEPLIKSDIERRRLLYVYKTLIDTPEARDLGLGDVSDTKAEISDCDHRDIVRAAAGAQSRRYFRSRVSACEGRPRSTRKPMRHDMTNDTSRTIACTHVIGAAQTLTGAQAITISGDRFASIAPTAMPATDRFLAMPALVNAHDHGRAVSTSPIGGDAKPLESWLPYFALFPSVDPYLARR